jgi:RHS repeat-associated protein
VSGVCLQNVTDYSPFGAPLDGRTIQDHGYRYGFIGQENDNEISGEGNSQDHKFRSYDTRLGRYKSIDPLSPSYPWYTPYQYAGNTPIMAIDIEGLEPSTVVDKQGKLTTSAIKILNVLTGVDEVLLQQVQIMGAIDNKFNAPWYNPNKGGGAITVGSTIYFTANWFAESGYGSSKYGNTSYGGEDARSVFMWMRLLSHEVGHLPQADAFGTDKTGIRSYLGYFAGGYILRSISFQFPIHDGFAAEVTAELGQYVFNQIFMETVEIDGKQVTRVNQLGKDFANAIANGNEEKVNEILTNVDSQIKTHTEQYNQDNAKKFQKMEKRLEKAESKKVKREAENSN